MRFSPTRALEQFVSTFKEWHYLIGGVSIGIILGWVAHALFTLTERTIMQ